MTKQTITYEGTHNGHKINTNKRKKQGCIKEIMNGYAIRLEAFTSKHVQTSVMQFTASAPASIPPDKTNKAIGDSIRAIKKTMGNNKIDFQAGWVKEIADGSDCRCHYQIGVIIDSSKCQSAVGIADQLRKLLKKKAKDESDAKTVSVHYFKPKHDKQGLHPIEKASAIKIRQDKPGAAEQFENAHDWLSYPAKLAQKDRLPPGRGYDFTRLPKQAPQKVKW